MGFFTALYGAMAYGVFLATLVHAIGFVRSLVVTQSADVGVTSGAAGALPE